MDKSASANAQQCMSLVARLQAGMAGVEILAKEPARERRPNDKVVAVCDDHLKRLSAYHLQLLAELEPLQDEGRNIEHALLKKLQELQKEEMNPGTLVLALADFVTPEMKAKAQRLIELKEQLDPLKRYASWVGGCFWPEVGNRLPATLKYPSLALRADWSIVVLEREEEDDLTTMLRDGLFGRGMGPNGHESDLDSFMGAMGRRHAHA